MTSDLQAAKAQLERAKAELAVAVIESGEAETREKPKKAPGSARGIETMFRSAYRVQMDLTGLADNKANMMISINGIIMSIIIASVAPKLDANPWLLIPTTVLLVGNLVSMIFAILAARPRVAHDPAHAGIPGPAVPHAGNILFFGTFANQSEDEFVQHMEEMMEQKNLVYETMIRNIHGLGAVLYRKFVLLQYAYSSFMVALILGVSSFIGVFVWLSQQSR
jgi:hypothetical protein